ncbi:methyl-accepting chemotaxis protein [Cerasibacillus sp. JNUCC 74]
MIKNLKIVKKLSLLVILAVLLLVTIFAFSFKYLHDMEENSKIMYEDYLISIDKLGKMQKNNFKIDASAMEAMRTDDQEKYDALIKNIDKLVNENLNLESKELFPKEIIDMDSYYELIDVYIKGRTTALEMAKKDQKKAYEYYLEHVTSKRAELDKVMTDIQQYFSDKANEINIKNKNNLQKATVTFFGIAAAGIVIFVIISLLIVKAIVKPIKQIQRLMAEVEHGKLTTGEYQADDELGQLFKSYNSMIKAIEDIIWSTQEASENVVSSSEQLTASAQQNTQASEHIASTIQELAAGSMNQLNNIEETASTLNTMITSFEKIANNATVISDNAKESANMSVQGKESIEEVTKQMKIINHNVIGLGKTIKNLSQSLSEIGTINKAITDIAGQTNLLSLNAAIEAARAGVHGEGFSVVAEEVRKLAEQSSQSAEQITRLIETIQSDTNETVESMDSTKQVVNLGTSVVHDAGQIFEKIEYAISDIVNQFSHISEDINSLSSGVSKVQQSVEGIKSVAEQAADRTQNVSAATEEQLASMEEIETSSENLAKISEDLQQLVNKFDSKD